MGHEDFETYFQTTFVASDSKLQQKHYVISCASSGANYIEGLKSIPPQLVSMKDKPKSDSKQIFKNG